MSLEGMKLIVIEQLPIIDQIVAKKGIALSSRPFEASVLFVSECIVEIKGDTKEDFLEKRWFSDIYQCVEDWYKERYGDALNKNDGNENSLVVLYRTPFKLNIPLTISKPNKDGDKVWLIFPSSVMPDEDVLSWLDNPPNINNMSEGKREESIKRIKEVAVLTRSIHVNLMTANYSTTPLQRLGGSISSHLSKAVEDILSTEQDRISLAFWEMHLAIEKTIKLYLRQNGISPPDIHDLKELKMLAENNDAPKETDRLFNILPTAKEAIKFRYGEIDNISLDKAIEVYKAVLELVAIYSKALKREFVMDNAGFLIQTPPWKKNMPNRVKGSI